MTGPSGYGSVPLSVLMTGEGSLARTVLGNG